MPDYKTAGGIQAAMEFSKLQEAEGAMIWFHHRSPFTMASNICGVENFMKWLFKKPALCEKLIEMATDHIFEVLNYWVDTFGEDKIFVFNSSPSESNQVISPKFFRKFAIPALGEYHDRLNRVGIKHYFFHICGDQNMNLPDLAEVCSWPHPGILSFGQEVDIKVAAQFFPEDIIFGNIDPIIIQIGTPQKLYSLCERIITDGKRCPGGFILGTGCDIPPNAPATNVFAMTKAVNDFGWYD